MISVVIETRNSEADLFQAMSPLVAAAMDGLVREVVVADAGSTDATLEVAEDAGAVIITGGLAEACMQAKGPWLMLMPVTARLAPDWILKVKGYLERYGEQPVRLIAKGLFGREQAFLAPKRRWLEKGRAGARTLRL